MLQQLVDGLQDRPDVTVELIDTRHVGAARGLRKLAAAARVMWHTLRRMRWAEIVVLHVSPPATVTFGPILYAITRIFRRPMVLRENGGSLDAEYRAMSRVKRLLLRIAFRADQVLLETHHLIDAFQHALPRANCQWYSNSRPIEKQPESSAHQPTGRFVFIGQVRPTKGVLDILEAVKLSHPNIGVDVYGPLMGGLTQEELPTEGQFRYRGVLDREAIVPTLRRYDAVLLPTHHYGEGYPGIILEAFAAGRPVIASRWRSIPEIVEDGVSGLLIPPHDPEALARAMASLVSSPTQLQRLTSVAATRARDKNLRTMSSTASKPTRHDGHLTRRGLGQTRHHHHTLTPCGVSPLTRTPSRSATTPPRTRDPGASYRQVHCEVESAAASGTSDPTTAGWGTWKGTCDA
jgi:glycosyltransferase involved in cell wall biosynthesis